MHVVIASVKAFSFKYTALACLEVINILLSFVTVCTRQVFNLAILVDGSASIKNLPSVDISRYKDLIKSIYNIYNVSQNGANVGVVVYSTNATTEFKFDTYYSKADVSSAIDSIVFPGESTRAGTGLTLVRNDLFANGRSGIPNFLVVLTDGTSTDDVSLPSALLRAMNVYILAVGIGDFYYKSQLNVMASKPASSYVFEASGYEMLSTTTATQIKQRICRGRVNVFVWLHFCYVELLLLSVFLLMLGVTL